MVCPNCNTRQSVPLDAAPESAEPPPPLSKVSLSYRTPECPFRYELAYFTALLITIAGFLVMVVGFFVAVDQSRRDGAPFLIWFAGAILNGVFLIALGQLLFLTRDIARNTWHR